jgi:hypothetical protein
LLLAAVATGLLGQGAYYASTQRYVVALVAAATALALATQPPTRADARVLPVLPAAALAAWAVLDAAWHGTPATSAGVALLLLGAVAVLVVCRRLGPADRELLLVGLVWIGLVVALAGWFGVAARVGSWAWEGQGIWRASSTLSYPNATAAVLAPVALLALARLVAAPRSVFLALAATGLLTGLAATASRAGALAFTVGVIVLAVRLGPRATARAALGPGAGALLALACLLPSMPAASPPRPGLALAGMSAGLAMAALVSRGTLVQRLPGRAVAALALAWVVAGGLVATAAVGAGLGEAVGEGVGAVAAARGTLASPARADGLKAAARIVQEHPLGGVGPGQAQLRWTEADGGAGMLRYTHNEYVQVAAELGLLGLTLLVVLLLAIARSLWTARASAGTAFARATAAGVLAGAVAFAVHSGFDFVWHLPAVVLTVLVLIGTVLPAPVTSEVATHQPRLNEGSHHENEHAH